MRHFILIAGFVLAAATAQAGDRSLSLAGIETTAVTAPAKTNDGPRIAQATSVPDAPGATATDAPAAEPPKYTQRPTLVEPKPEPTTKSQARIEPAAADPARPVARKTYSSRSERPRRTRYWNEARIIRELNRHGIYW